MQLPYRTDVAVRTYWLLIARVGCIAVAVLSLTAFVLGIVPRYHVLVREAQEYVTLMATFGLPVDVLPPYRLALEIAFTLAFVVPALLIFWYKSDSYATLFVSLTLLTFGIIEAFVTGTLVRVEPAWKWPLEFVQTVATIGCLILFFVFPNGKFAPRWTRPLAVVWAGLNLVWLLWPNAPLNHISGAPWRRALPYSLLFSLAWFGVGSYAQVSRYRSFADPGERQQTKWVIFGLLIAMIGATLRFMRDQFPQIFSPSIPQRLIFEFGLIPLAGLLVSAVPVCIGLSILRYRLWDIDVIINRTLVYGGLTASVVLVYGSSVLVFQQILRALTGQESTLAIVAATLLSSLLFRPLRNHLQTIIDRRFYRKNIDFRQAFTDFAGEIRTLTALPDLVHVLLTRTTGLLQSAHGALYVRNADGQLVLAEAHNLSLDDARSLHLDDEVLGQLRAGTGIARPSESRFVLLLPLTGLQSNPDEKLVGVLALGPRLSGQRYSKLDYDVLMSLAQQAGLAISASQFIAFGRQLEASPTGRAETKARELVAQPRTAFFEIHRLAHNGARDRDVAGLLANLPQALLQLGAQPLARCAEGFNYVIASQSAPELTSVALRTLAGQLEQPTINQWDETAAVVRLYEVCYAALEVPSIAAITRLSSRLRAKEHLPVGLGPDFEVGPKASTETSDSAAKRPGARDASVPAHILSEMANMLSVLAATAEALHAFERAETPHDHLTYLSQAIERLRRASHERLPLLPFPEQRIFQAIIERWTVLTAESLRTVHGQARLEVTVITRQIIAAERVTLVLEIANVGRSPAVNVTVGLGPDEGYRVLELPGAIECIQPAQSILVQCVVQPAGDTSFRPCFQIRYDDGEQTGKVLLVSPTVHILPVPATFTPISNPYVPGMPLHLNSPVFFGREDLFTWIHEMLHQDHGPNALLLTGERRMGKTSLLRQLPPRISERYIPIYLDGQSLAIDPGMPAFFYDVALEIADALALPPPTLDSFEVRASMAFEREFLPRAVQAAGQRRLLLLFDEFEELEARVQSGKLDGAVFPFLRHLMQLSAHLAFVFVGTHKPEALTGQHWSKFFNVAVYQRIGCLGRHAAHALITQPVGLQLFYDDLAIDKMLRVTAGHPYFLQLLCYALVRTANAERRNYIALAHVDDALDQVLELGAAHLDDLWRGATRYERIAMGILAQMMFLSQQATLPEIMAYSAKQGNQLDQRELREALQRLTLRDILAVTSFGDHSVDGEYRWQLEVIGRWVTKTQAWRRIINDDTNSTQQS